MSKRNRDATRPAKVPTKTHTMQTPQSDVDQPQKCKTPMDERRVVQDFENDQMFVDLDVSTTHVLHVPED
jgi:hypothetical protein